MVPFNASLNATARVLLGNGYVFLRRLTPDHDPRMLSAYAASSLFLIISYLYQPRPGALGPLPRCGAAPPHLLRASRSTSRASGARGAARANDIHRAWHRPSGCTRATCRRRDGV